MAPKLPPSSANRTLTANEIAKAARSAGFSGDDLVIAIAVALAESGGAQSAINRSNSNGTQDYGLWQINSVHRSLFDQHPNWWEPNTNAAMAYSVYSRSGWKAWTTYKADRHEPFMTTARNAALLGGREMHGESSALEEAFGAGIDLATAVGGLANAALGIAQTVVKASKWLSEPSNWIRVAYVGVGGALLVGALVMVSKPAANAVAAVAK